MSTQLGNVIRWAGYWAAALLVILAWIVAWMVLMGMVSAYPALVACLAFVGAVTVWCVNRLLWHWKALKPLERFKIFIAGLVGAGILAWPVQKAPDLYVGILVVGLLLA
jgi:hypothetical protein